MGRFVLTVRAQGVSFLLADNEGKILMNSALYAGVDTAKKGIRSLAAVAPEAPVIDKSIGEHGPNPKFELSGGEDGFFFLLRSANGKPIFRSPDYADREKCLLAIEALRKGVRDATGTVYEREAGYSPVRMRRSCGKQCDKQKEGKEETAGVSPVVPSATGESVPDLPRALFANPEFEEPAFEMPQTGEDFPPPESSLEQTSSADEPLLVIRLSPSRMRKKAEAPASDPRKKSRIFRFFEVLRGEKKK